MPFNLLAQHWYSMDINIDKGRQNDAVQLMDDYFSKYGTEGMGFIYSIIILVIIKNYPIIQLFGWEIFKQSVTG